MLRGNWGWKSPAQLAFPAADLQGKTGVHSLLVIVLLGKTNGSVVELHFLSWANLIVLCKSLSVGLV